MAEQQRNPEPAGLEGDSSERDAQRAVDAASAEPRTFAEDERKDRAAKLDERATADQTAARRTDPSEDRALG